MLSAIVQVHTSNKFHFSGIHRSMQWVASKVNVTPSDFHTLMNGRNMKFISYIYIILGMFSMNYSLLIIK